MGSQITKKQKNTGKYVGSLAGRATDPDAGHRLLLHRYRLGVKMDIPKICLKFDLDFAIVYLDVFSFVELVSGHKYLAITDCLRR